MSSSTATHRNGESYPVFPQSSRPSRSSKSHGKTLTPLVDSSEDEPSPHSSIFEAPLASDSENECVGSVPRKGASIKAVRNSEVGIREDEAGLAAYGGSQSPLSSSQSSESALVPESRYPDTRRSGRPSPVLGTIIEQKSNNTLRETEAADEMEDSDSDSEQSDGYEDGDDSSLLPKDRRKEKHRRSSSIGDYFDYYGIGEAYDYASPSQPLYQSISVLNNSDSPLSPATPLGGTPPLSASFFNRNYSPSSPIRTQLPGPTFRPPTSGYRSYGTLTNHPFHNAPVARSDRGEGSMRGGAISGSGTSTPDSLSSLRGGRSRDGRASGENSRVATGGRKLWKVVCGVLCCLGNNREEE